MLRLKNTKLDLSDYYPLLFTIVFVVILFQYPLANVESLFYDFRIRTDFSTSPSKEIVLITMDEESDDYLGDIYPYSYATHLRFLNKLFSASPKVVSYLVNMAPHAAHEVENNYFEEFKNKIKQFEQTTGKFSFGTDMSPSQGELIPPGSLQELNFHLAQINIDNYVFAKDDVVRRAIVNVSGEESLHLWVANRFREFTGEKKIEAQEILGVTYNGEADANFVLIKYLGSPIYSEFKYKTIPFHRVLVGNFSPEFFKDKIVLVGPNYISQPGNFYLTPFNLEEYKAPKLVIHASIIDSFLNNKTIKPIPRNFSYVVAILLAIVLSILITRLKPKDGLIITVLILIAIFLISHLLFSFLGLWLYTAHLIVTIFVVYYIWIPFRAIGEYQRRFAIQEETKLLKKVEKLKQNFLSLMSHDLKTPVAKIAGVADNIFQQAKENEIKDKTRIIIDSTKELNKFISSILDLTKIESSNFGLTKSSKDINQLIETALHELNFSANAKRIRITKELSPLYPIEIDVNLITRVISNLVENAIKYCPEDSQVSVKSWDDDKWVYVEIKDNGPGIPKEEIENIFEKFYRIKNDANHSIKGTGLGLYLVKYFVELHGGSIVVQSESGQGTKFTVKLVNQ